MKTHFFENFSKGREVFPSYALIFAPEIVQTQKNNMNDYPECPSCGNDDLIYNDDGTVECPVCGETWNVEEE